MMFHEAVLWTELFYKNILRLQTGSEYFIVHLVHQRIVKLV